MGGKLAVIGAGVGGLSTAARLAKRGYEVTVFEKLNRCGGRANILEDRGFKFDTGPSFVLMPDFFEELFLYCGKRIENHINLKIVDPSYTIFYPDGDRLTVHRDSEMTKKELENIEKGSSRRFDDFIKETSRIYKTLRPMLYTCFTKKDIFKFKYLSLLRKIKPLESYWQMARKFFKTEKLCYAFTFEAMFMGVSPFEAPAFYSIISYTDHIQKIFHPMGGMYRIPLVIEDIAREFGVKFYYSKEIKDIIPRNGRIILNTTEGEQFAFDKVVVNADYAYAQKELLKRRLRNYKYSCSVFLIYLGLKKKTNLFSHHNLFFSSNLRRNLDEIFKDKVMPADPSFYLHVPTVTDPSLAPEGKDIFYILIPVANLEYPKKGIKFDEAKLRSIVFDKISNVLGEDIEDLIELEHRFYPTDFIKRYNILYGATFGLAHNLMQSAFFRPANFDHKIRNLYFVGASTQPGGGLPVVIAGSRIVADLIEKDK